MLGFGICFPPHPLSMWIWKGRLTEPSASVCAHPAPSLSPQVILKDLELLAEIASSPAGQTEEGHSVSDGSDVRPGPVELHVPARAGQLSSSSECPCATAPCLPAPGLSPCSMAPVRFAQAKGDASFTVLNQCLHPHPA